MLVLRYSRYIHLIQMKFGDEGALLTEELLRSGSHTASNIIIKSQANNDKKDNTGLVECRDKFIDLVHSHYFIRAPGIIDTTVSVPKFTIEPSKLFTVPNIEIPELIRIKNGDKVTPSDEGIYWLINFDRFHQDFRDTLMISAIERQIDPNAGECLKYILQQMYSRTDPWRSVSQFVGITSIECLLMTLFLILDIKSNTICRY